MTKKYIYGPGMDNPAVMINVSGQNETWYYYYADAKVDLLAQAATLASPAVMTAESLDMGLMAMGSPEAPLSKTEEFYYDHLGNRYQSVDKNGLVSTYTHTASINASSP